MKRVGIVGAGGMARYHREGFRAAGAEVKAICDTNRQAAEAFSGGELAVYGSLSEMLAAEKLDAVSIATPNRFHAPLALEAMEKGLSVYCEKPPALNASEMAAMKAKAEEKGVLLMFGFNNRARPESLAMKHYIDNGDAGRINSAQAMWIRRAGIPGIGGWFTNKALSGGGPVVDLPHMTDLALSFMGYPEPDTVLASTFSDFMGDPAFKGPWGIPDNRSGVCDVEAACHAFVTFRGGSCLSIRSSWAEMNEREVVSVTFQGTKAGGKVERIFDEDGIDETSHDSSLLFTVENGVHVDRKIKAAKDETMGRVRNASNFILAMEGKEKPFNTPSEALILMKIIDAIYLSAERGEAVKVE